MNHAAVNMGVQIPLWGYSFYFLCVYTHLYMYAYVSPEGGLPDHVLVLFLFFWGTSTLFGIVAETIHTSTNSVEVFPFLYTHGYTYYLLSFGNNHPTRCEVISYYDFDLHLPDDQWCWTPFQVPVGHRPIFFRKMSIWVLCPLLKLSCLSCLAFLYWVVMSSLALQE